MKRLIMLLVAVCTLLAANAAKPALGPTPIKDLALIYQGSDSRIKWTADELMPYVTHTYADGHQDWLFDGFLFLELNNGRKKCFSTLEIRDGYTPADRNDWQTQLDRLFAPDQALDALDKAITKAKGKLGDPGFRHKVVVMVPAPIAGFADWGKKGRKKLDFNKEKDRVNAMKWYVDEIQKRFKAAKYANIDLDGIYWIDEMQRDASDLPRQIAPYIHKKGLRFYWIPFFAAEGFDRWKELGFDQAYLQPNYFFRPAVPDSRLSQAVQQARANSMGLEMELDERIINDPKVYLPRMDAYLNAFERAGTFRDMPMAYYLGSVALLSASRNPKAECTPSVDRMASLISGRRAKATTPASGANKPNTTAPDYDQLRKNAKEVKF